MSNVQPNTPQVHERTDEELAAERAAGTGSVLRRMTNPALGDAVAFAVNPSAWEAEGWVDAGPADTTPAPAGAPDERTTLMTNPLTGEAVAEVGNPEAWRDAGWAEAADQGLQPVDTTTDTAPAAPSPPVPPAPSGGGGGFARTTPEQPARSGSTPPAT